MEQSSTGEITGNSTGGSRSDGGSDTPSERFEAGEQHGLVHAEESPSLANLTVEAENAVRESAERFRLVWEAAADGMVLSDPRGVVVAVNPAYCRIYGYAPHELVGRSFAVIFPEEVRDWAVKEYEAVFTRQEIAPIVEAEIRRKNGSVGAVEVEYTFITRNDKRIAMLSIVRDVTERNRLLADEHAARAEAEAAVRARDQFLSIVSHDLKNPLSVISGQAQVLQRRLVRDSSEELPGRELLLAGLAQIEAAAAKMDGLIGGLLDIAAVQAGQPLELACEETDLVALARQVCAEQQIDGRRPIQVVSTAPTLIGYWDRARLERMLDNLLANAIKYSPAGGEIRVDVGREDSQTGSWAILVVRDQGIGIPATDLPHIFEWYRRGGNVGDEIRGTGIGLAAVHQVVEQHGGTIAAESVEGLGSVFTVRLPLLLEQC